MPSRNEWSKLKKVIVGSADGARIPDIDISLRVVNYADKTDEEVQQIKTGLYPQQVIDEANEDLEIFCEFLQSEGVEVVRPNNIEPSYYNYCPRDNVIIYDDVAIATPMPIRSRKNDFKSFSDHLPLILDLQQDHQDSLYNQSCVGNTDVLALNENAPAFDAANVLRANDDVLYLVSNSGNKSGANLLQESLGNRANVHLLENVYSYMHIDSTIAFLREGLMLANPSRIKSKDNLPLAFRNWDIIWAPEPVDIGYYPGYCNASKWVNINLFSLNENLVVVEEHQDNLRKELEKHNIECAMLPMRHSRTLGGVFHCVTLDLERE